MSDLDFRNINASLNRASAIWRVTNSLVTLKTRIPLCSGRPDPNRKARQELSFPAGSCELKDAKISFAMTTLAQYGEKALSSLKEVGGFLLPLLKPSPVIERFLTFQGTLDDWHTACKRFDEQEPMAWTSSCCSRGTLERLFHAGGSSFAPGSGLASGTLRQAVERSVRFRPRRR